MAQLKTYQNMAVHLNRQVRQAAKTATLEELQRSTAQVVKSVHMMLAMQFTELKYM